MPVSIPVEALTPVFGPAKDPNLKEVAFKMKVYPGYISYLSNKGEALLEGKQYLTTLSARKRSWSTSRCRFSAGSFSPARSSSTSSGRSSGPGCTRTRRSTCT